jgi:hypothetical protein
MPDVIALQLPESAAGAFSSFATFFSIASIVA